jgi:hypothetical protein
MQTQPAETKIDSAKKNYHAPRLTEWGELQTITRGEIGSFLDENFTLTNFENIPFGSQQ